MIKRIAILQDTFRYFQQITQWIPFHLDTASKYMQKAESLIELLEVQDCGSIGGFDKDNPVINTTGFSLYDRYLALVHKYNNEADIEPVCDFTLDTMSAYYIELKTLRSKHRNS